jgi:hypothetical protein
LQKIGVKKNGTQVCPESSRNQVREIDCLLGHRMGRVPAAHPAPAVLAEDQKHDLRLFKINREAEWEFLVLADRSTAKKTTEPHI